VIFYTKRAGYTAAVTAVCIDMHFDTSPTSSPQALKSHLDIDYVLPTDARSLYRAVDSTCRPTARPRDYSSRWSDDMKHTAR